MVFAVFCLVSPLRKDAVLICYTALNMVM